MGKVNWGRVLLGGLAAGLVIDLSEYVLNTFVWAAQNAAALEALNIQMRANAIPIYLTEGLLRGIAAVWVYAAARPRYGAGAKTATITALGVWVFSYVLPNLDSFATGLFSGRLLCLWTIAGLPEIIVASVVGAALYKEA